MTLLAHTRLHAPDPRPTVTSLSELSTSHGVVWVADVEMDGTHLGTFENNGFGCKTNFIPDDTAVYGPAHLEAFAASCSFNGKPVDAERVMNLLVEEYDAEVMVREVHGHAGTFARQFADGVLIAYAKVATRPHTHAEYLALARELSPRPPRGSISVTWQVWTGEQWRDLPAATID